MSGRRPGYKRSVNYALPAVLLGLSGCATAQLAQERAFFPPDPGVPRTVVLEPLFELANWQTTTRTEYARVMGSPFGSTGMLGYGYGYGYGSSAYPTTVAVTREVQEKPLFARPQVMTEIHRRLLNEVQRRRPAWRVTSTSGTSALRGDVTVVRTIIEGNQTTESDRALKNLALGFGFVIWPLEFIHIDPVHETMRVMGLVERFDAPAELLGQRLVRYPTQPDFAVNLSGLTPLRRPFGLDVSYTEGILASEYPRTQVLLDGFANRLASAVIALVEEPPISTSTSTSIPPATPTQP